MSRRRRIQRAAALVPIAALTLAACGTAAAPVGHVSPHRASSRAIAHVAEAPDPLAAQSYPEPVGAPKHARAVAPATAAAAAVSPGAPSTAQVSAELAQERALERSDESGRLRGVGGEVDAISGAFTPANTPPPVIAEVIAGGNAIADFPYVYGGGHRSFIDDAYDCSGSVSYALAAGGLIGRTETSGQLESWGAPGPGRYLTVFATAGHTFMYVDGLWFDTAGRAGPYSTRWLTARPSLAGYVERHYPGL